MTEGKTTSGFEFKIDERMVKDQDFLDALLDAHDATDDMEKMSATRKLYMLVLGKEAYEALKEHIREQYDGICDAEAFANAFGEILNSVKDLKN